MIGGRACRLPFAAMARGGFESGRRNWSLTSSQVESVPQSGGIVYIECGGKGPGVVMVDRSMSPVCFPLIMI